MLISIVFRNKVHSLSVEKVSVQNEEAPLNFIWSFHLLKILLKIIYYFCGIFLLVLEYSRAIWVRSRFFFGDYFINKYILILGEIWHVFP